MGATQTKPTLYAIFERAIDAFPLKTGDKIVVAVSGGADSVCLLHLLRQYPFKLHVAHLNHQFRSEGIKEAQFVERLSTSWNIPVTVTSLPVPEMCKTERLSKQEGARKVRYSFLKQVARDTGARWIAVGHTADDQIETFLMRLLRGSGIEGLASIPKMREGLIIRPLLSIRRETILFELSRLKIAFVEDPSNVQPVYLRNQIRHSLLPILEQYNPKIKEALLKEVELLQSEGDFLRQQTLQVIKELDIETDERSICFDIHQLKSLHLALQRKILRWGINTLQNDLKGIGFKHIDTILSKVIPGPTGGRCMLPNRLRVEKRYCDLILEQMGGERNISPPRAMPQDVEIVSLGEKMDLPEWGIRLIFSLQPGAHPFFSPCTASFDFDTIGLPLSIRGFQPGDRFVPSGMKGRHKKLQDFFVDAKIPAAKRRWVPLLSCPRGIIWVIGHRMDERFQATGETMRTLTVTIENNHPV